MLFYGPTFRHLFIKQNNCFPNKNILHWTYSLEWPSHFKFQVSPRWSWCRTSATGNADWLTCEIPPSNTNMHTNSSTKKEQEALALTPSSLLPLNLPPRPRKNILEKVLYILRRTTYIDKRDAKYSLRESTGVEERLERFIYYINLLQQPILLDSVPCPGRCCRLCIGLWVNSQY